MDLATLKKDISFKIDRYDTYKILYKKEHVGLVKGNSWSKEWIACDTTSRDLMWHGNTKHTERYPTRYQAAVALLSLQNKVHTIKLDTKRASHIENNWILSIDETYLNDNKTQILTRALISGKQGKTIRNLMLSIDLKTKKALTLSQKQIKIDNLDEYIELIQKSAGKK